MLDQARGQTVEVLVGMALLTRKIGVLSLPLPLHVLGRISDWPIGQVLIQKPGCSRVSQ